MALYVPPYFRRGSTAVSDVMARNAPMYLLLSRAAIGPEGKKKVKEKKEIEMKRRKVEWSEIKKEIKKKKKERRRRSR